MTYFVTGATGFIGRHLVERLLEREGDVHVLVREGSTDKLRRWAGNDRVKPVIAESEKALAEKLGSNAYQGLLQTLSIFLHD